MKLATLPTQAGIRHLKSTMLAMPQVDLSQHTRHHFADNNRLYGRELFREADTTIVGKVHRREHLYIVLSGEVTVSGEGYRETLKAPRVVVSKPGTERAVYAHVDSICMTVHFNPTGTTDLDEITRELIEPDETAMFDSGNRLKVLP